LDWYTFWLILHVIGAVVAFGPTYVFPLISTRGKKNPKHASFAAEVTVAIAERYTMPAAISLLASGLAMMFIRDINLVQNGWLLISFILYFIAVGYSIFNQTPTGKQLVRILKESDGPPPPEVSILGKRMAVGGVILAVISLVIFVLMIWKPGA